MTIDNIEKYLSKRKTDFDLEIINKIEKHKDKAVHALNEELANNLWCLSMIAKIQSGFLSIYKNLKMKKNHMDAWKTLERIDVKLSFLRKNFSFDNEKYYLRFIENIIKEYEKLFPYFLFSSREGIIKKKECSICGKEVSLRNPCGHKVGSLYMGEMCCHKIVDYELLSISLVSNPFDKYAVLMPEGKEYNYFMLNLLMDNMNSPYERFRVDILMEVDQKYKDVGRNDLCPCGSNKKYKKCCMDTKRELFEHRRITYLDNSNVKSTPMIKGNTWKS